MTKSITMKHTFTTMVLLCFGFPTGAVLQVPPGSDELLLLAEHYKGLGESFRKGELPVSEYRTKSRELLLQLGATSYAVYEELNAADRQTPQDSSTPQTGMPEGQDTIPEASFPQSGPGRTPGSLLRGNHKRTSVGIRYGMFFNGLALSESRDGVNYPDFSVGRSFNWFGEFDILLNTRLGKPNGPLSIYYGIGWDNRCFVQKGDDVQRLILDGDKASFAPAAEQPDRVELRLRYFRFPLGLQAKTGKWAFNAGTYLGLRISHKQILEYETAEGEEASLTLDKNYDFNKVNYGLSASIGYKRIHLGFQYDLSKLFKNSVTFDYQPWRIGVMLF